MTLIGITRRHALMMCMVKTVGVAPISQSGAMLTKRHNATFCGTLGVVASRQSITQS